MQDPITITLMPDLKMLEKVSMYNLGRVLGLRFLPLGLAAFIMLHYYTSAMGQDSGLQILPVVCVILFWTAIYFITRRGIRSTLLNNPQNREVQELTLSERGLTISSDSFFVTYNWEQIRSVKETKEWFLFFPGKAAAIPIPKSMISQSENKEIKEAIKKAPVKQNLK